jgi:hypothetical protein
MIMTRSTLVASCTVHGRETESNKKIPTQPAQAAAIASDIGICLSLHQCTNQIVIAWIYIRFVGNTR